MITSTLVSLDPEPTVEPTPAVEPVRLLLPSPIGTLGLELQLSLIHI